MAKGRVVQSGHCGSSGRWQNSTMAVGHRGCRRAQPIRCPRCRFGVAAEVCRGCAAGAGRLVTGGPGRRRACRPRAPSRSLPSRELCRSWLFGLCTDKQEAVPQHVDDTRSAANVGPLVTTLGAVDIAGIVAPVGISTVRRPLRCTHGSLCRPRHLDPDLRHALLIAQRQAVPASDSAAVRSAWACCRSAGEAAPRIPSKSRSVTPTSMSSWKSPCFLEQLIPTVVRQR